jgi:hypothetical protein
MLISSGAKMNLEPQLIVIAGCLIGMGLLIAFMHLYKN